MQSRNREPEDVRVRPRDHWDDSVRDRLVRDIEPIRQVLFHEQPAISTALGILPAVYFTDLRMGSILGLHHWYESSREYFLAMPNHPPHVPEPFSCFVPKTNEPNVALITKIAQVFDTIQLRMNERAERRAKPEEMPLPALPTRARITYSRSLRMWVGSTSWEWNDTAFLIDSHLLHEAGLRTLTTVFLVPFGRSPVSYIPLLYLQSSEAFVPGDVEQTIAELVAPSRIDDDPARAIQKQILERALLSVAHACRLRAREWLNPKTLLLSQAGFQAIRRDLVYRIRRDPENTRFAEGFFDIDGFKALNDQIGYDKADDVARLLARKAREYTHEQLQEDFQPFIDEAGAFAAKGQWKTDTPNLEARHPSGFFGFLAHVSGDEFKFYIRVTPPPPGPSVFHDVDDPRDERQKRRKTDTELVEDRLKDLVDCAREPDPDTTGRSAAHESMHRPPATVSLGVALIVTHRLAMPKQVDSASAAPEEIEAEREVRNRLSRIVRHADTLAERALDGAKRRGRKRMMFFHDLLRDGGAVLEVLPTQIRLSIGEIDGVLREDEFDVYKPSGDPTARRITEDRRFWRKPLDWVARVRVHQIWPRESVAYPVVGDFARIRKDDWVRRSDIRRGRRQKR